jgi:hypothetical protein
VTANPPAPEYVLARRVLLDGLQAMGVQRGAVILVGAQAVYFHAGDADLAIPPMTTDADVAVDPSRLHDEPLLADALTAAGFVLGRNPGSWRGAQGVMIDVMVPEALSGPPSRRGAQLPVHGNRVARRTHGLEAAIVDNSEYEIGALDPSDSRRYCIRIAGPAALLVAKVIKIDERHDQPRRLVAKDGLDILRILQTTDTEHLAARLVELSDDPLAGQVTVACISALRGRGHDPDAEFATLAATAVAGLAEAATIRESFAALVEDLLSAIPTGPKA